MESATKQRALILYSDRLYYWPMLGLTAFHMRCKSCTGICSPKYSVEPKGRNVQRFDFKVWHLEVMVQEEHGGFRGRLNELLQTASATFKRSCPDSSKNANGSVAIFKPKVAKPFSIPTLLFCLVGNQSAIIWAPAKWPRTLTHVDVVHDLAGNRHQSIAQQRQERHAPVSAGRTLDVHFACKLTCRQRSDVVDKLLDQRHRLRMASHFQKDGTVQSTASPAFVVVGTTADHNCIDKHIGLINFLGVESA